jgi:hypothetical protein
VDEIVGMSIIVFEYLIEKFVFGRTSVRHLFTGLGLGEEVGVGLGPGVAGLVAGLVVRLGLVFGMRLVF